jgi:long-chain acyl-CoA synthetase
MYLTSLVARAARIFGSRPASTNISGVSRDWGETLERIGKLAGGFLALGLRNGDRVALLGHNSAEYLEAMYSTFWAGGVCVPLNIRLSTPELVTQILDSGASLLVADRSYMNVASEVAKARPSLKVIEMGAGTEAALHSTEGIIDGSQPTASAGRGGDDLASIYYTGGTTGSPKGVMLSHANILSSVLNVQPLLALDESTRCLHLAPIFHAAVLYPIFGVTAIGGHHLFLHQFEAKRALNAISGAGINFLCVVPTMLKRLLEEEDFEAKQMRSLKDVFYGGSAIPAPTVAAAITELPWVRFHQGYGLTETAATITYLGPEHHVLSELNGGKLRSVGRQVMGIDLEILDHTGTPVEVGKVGEICVRGGSVSAGYWENPKVTEWSFHGSWFRTGDLGFLDPDGFLYIADRLKDIIISGGENIYSAEVEHVLSTHPSVVECAAIGVADEDWGERVHVVARLSDNDNRTSGEDLILYLRPLLANYKVPKSIEIVRDPLPLTSLGKISKAILKARFTS